MISFCKDTKNQWNNQYIFMLYLMCFHTSFRGIRKPVPAYRIFVMFIRKTS